MPDPATQLEIFAHAVDLLGGQRATARALGIHERSVRALLAGPEAGGRALHDGFLRDIAKALLAHAEACRLAERRLSPAFAANLTLAQAKANRVDGRRKDRQTAQVLDLMLDAFGTAQLVREVPLRWEVNAAAWDALAHDERLAFRGIRFADLTDQKLLGVPLTLLDDKSTSPRFNLMVKESPANG